MTKPKAKKPPAPAKPRRKPAPKAEAAKTLAAPISPPAPPRSAFARFWAWFNS